MLRRLVEFALSQRMLMLVLAALLAAAGGYAFSRLPIDAYPDISTTQVKLIMKAPGMTPEEVEQRVIAPLELELLGIPNQLILRSTAKYAIADITIDFTDSTDVYWARQQVGERLSGVMDALPDTVSGGLAPIAGSSRTTSGTVASSKVAPVSLDSVPEKPGGSRPMWLAATFSLSPAVCRVAAPSIIWNQASSPGATVSALWPPGARVSRSSANRMSGTRCLFSKGWRATPSAVVTGAIVLWLKWIAIVSPGAALSSARAHHDPAAKRRRLPDGGGCAVITALAGHRRRA